jgi:hypothetical protein
LYEKTLYWCEEGDKIFNFILFFQLNAGASLATICFLLESSGNYASLEGRPAIQLNSLP